MICDRIANEILMHFRSQRKSAQDVSLSDYIESGADGAQLSLMDVISDDKDLFEEICSRESFINLHRAIQECLTDQEKMIVTLRYGLKGNAPMRQREVAMICNISRSYVSRLEKKAVDKLRTNLLKKL